MVARIRTGKNIERALRYNEQKVLEQRAKILEANNFFKAAEQLTAVEKLAVFKKLIALNERTTTNALHVSLNFDPTENLSEEKLKAIARDYMKGIGFADQPYLVYRHDDAGHPHIHIVSTNIRWDGSRISMHNLGRTKSEVTRKEIEERHGLTKAEDSRKRARLAVDNNGIARYGKESTKQAIARIVSLSLNKYKPTSLDELKAVLNLYQVAVIESFRSRERQHPGLSFVVTDSLGKTISAPVKASRLPLRPTFKNLQPYFKRHQWRKESERERLQARVQQVLAGKNVNGKTVEQQLLKFGIALKVEQAKNGELAMLRFIDHRSGCVYSGHDFSPVLAWQDLPLVKEQRKVKAGVETFSEKARAKVTEKEATSVLNLFGDKELIPEEQGVPYPWKKPKKRKRKRLK